MPFAYPYVGPVSLLSTTSPPGSRVVSAADFPQWANDELVTFVVGLDGVLRLAPRRSEHVACAGALEVLAAGELHAVRAPGGLRVITVSNQSTGFCPAVDCWSEVVSALSFDGVVLPTAFTHAIEFRRCPRCRETNLVKESWFVCVFCESPLPLEWNVSARRAVQK
ncbi:MAG: hypothetical protein GQE15_02920 [Archangiaceae bacterium]|nr:hypothetical protein [Archangiaceae bacterium]